MNLLFYVLFFSLTAFIVNACDDGTCSEQYLEIKYQIEVIYQSCQQNPQDNTITPEPAPVPDQPTPQPEPQPEPQPVAETPSTETSPEAEQPSPQPQPITGGGGQEGSTASSSSTSSSVTSPQGAQTFSQTSTNSTGSGQATANAQAIAKSWSNADANTATNYFQSVSSSFSQCNQQIQQNQVSLTDAEAQDLYGSLVDIQTSLDASIQAIIGLQLNVNILGLLSLGVSLGSSVSDLYSNIDLFTNLFIGICPNSYRKKVANVCANIKSSVQTCCDDYNQYCS